MKKQIILISITKIRYRRVDYTFFVLFFVCAFEITFLIIKLNRTKQSWKRGEKILYFTFNLSILEFEAKLKSGPRLKLDPDPDPDPDP